MSTKMDVRKYIKIRGANENNLKNIDVDIPRNDTCCTYRIERFGQIFPRV